MSIADRIGLTRKITRPRTEAFVKRYATADDVLDIGCGNDLYRHLFPNLKTLELNPRGDVDYVADVTDMHMIPDATFGMVLLLGVLEHVEEPHKAIAEIHRILKPGGRVLFSSPFVYPLHDYPGDYWRFTDKGLEILFRDFSIDVLEPQADTMETLAILCQRIGFQCDTLGVRLAKAGWFLLARLFLSLRWILRREYGDIGNAVRVPSIMTSGYHVVLRK